MSISGLNRASHNLSLKLSPSRKVPSLKPSFYSPSKTKYRCHLCNSFNCHCYNCCCCYTCFTPYLDIASFSSSKLLDQNEEENNFKNSENISEILETEIKEESNKIYNTCANYEQNQFNDFLKKMMEIESKIEDAKILLALNSDFNCEDAFRLFESNNRGFLNKDDIQNGLNEIGIFPTGKKLRLLIKRFDLQKNGFLNYADFFDMVVPFEKKYRQRVENRQIKNFVAYRPSDLFSNKTIYDLNNVLNLIFDFENELNDDRKLLKLLRLNLNDIFEILDKNKKGYFDYSDLMEYFKNNGMLENNREADLLFIRLDKKRNGKIGYFEIEDELQIIY